MDDFDLSDVDLKCQQNRDDIRALERDFDAFRWTCEGAIMEIRAELKRLSDSISKQTK